MSHRLIGFFLITFAPWCPAEEITAELTEYITEITTRVWKGDVISISTVEADSHSNPDAKEIEIVVFTSDQGYSSFRMQFVDGEWTFSREQWEELRMIEEVLPILRQLASEKQ